MRHVAVIGGGPAGLFGALVLAQEGHRVTLIEAGTWGGRARSVGPEGYALNLGAHALYPDSAARLRRHRIAVDGGEPVARGFRMEMDGQVVPLPAGALGLLSHRSLRISEKLSLARWLASVSARRGGVELHEVPVSAWMDGAGLAGGARKVAEMLVRLTSYTNAPDRLSAAAARAQLAAGFAGVLYVHGGWQSIVRGLLTALAEAGVTLMEHTRATGVGPEGVQLADGSRVGADSVVLAVSPKVAARLLGANASAGLVRFAERAVPVRAACLDVASAALPGEATVLLGADRPTYLSVPSVSARVAPHDHSAVHLARYLVPGAPASKGVRAELEAQLESAHPELSTAVVHARYSPAMTVMHAMPEAATGGLLGRPDVDDAGPPWARLAGDWVGPDGMLLDAALCSAERAARSLSDQSVVRCASSESRSLSESV